MQQACKLCGRPGAGTFKISLYLGSIDAFICNECANAVAQQQLQQLILQQAFPPEKRNGGPVTAAQVFQQILPEIRSYVAHNNGFTNGDYDEVRRALNTLDRIFSQEVPNPLASLDDQAEHKRVQHTPIYTGLLALFQHFPNERYMPQQMAYQATLWVEKYTQKLLSETPAPPIPAHFTKALRTLELLYSLKEHKDKNGKDKFYDLMRPIMWEDAKTTLISAGILQPDPPEDDEE